MRVMSLVTVVSRALSPPTARNNDGAGILLHLRLAHIHRRGNCPISSIYR